MKSSTVSSSARVSLAAQNIDGLNNFSNLLNIGIGSRDVSSDGQNLPDEKNIYIVDQDGNRKSLKCVNRDFNVSSLSMMEETAISLAEQCGKGASNVRAFWHGSRHVAEFRVPLFTFDIIRLDGKKDQHEAWASNWNGFTGTSANMAGIHMLRLVCLNGARAMKTFKAFSIKNTKYASARMEQADASYQNLVRIAMEEKELLQRFANKRVDDETVMAVVTQAITGKRIAKDEDMTTKTANQIDKVYSLTMAGRGNDGATLFDLYNGITEYSTHSRGHADNREEENAIGNGAKFVSNARELITQLL